MRVLIFSFLMLFVANSVSYADPGISVGSEVTSFSLKDQKGENQNIQSLSGEKGFVLAFIRSADWCPYCQAQLIELNDRVQDFEERGYKLVSLSYDSVEKLSKFHNKYDTDLTLLSDPDSATIKAFGLLNEEYAEGHFAHGVPYPAIYVIGKDGFVKARYTEDGYKKRPSLDDVLNGIDHQGLLR